MRTLILFFCLLQSFCFSTQAQDDESKNRWTISTIYSPRLEKNERTRNFQEHYPLSPGLAVEYRINESFSISLGTSLNYEKIKMKPLVFNEPPKIKYGYFTSTRYGFPIQIKYFYTKDKSKRLLPFFKTAFIYTYDRLYSEVLYISQDLSTYRYDEFYFYWQLGYGADLKIYKRLSMTAQIAFGFDLRNNSSDKSHIEPLVGLRYNFK